MDCMQTTELIGNQVQLVHGRLSGLAGATTEEWLARTAPGENRIGFLAWHVVATRDWLAQSILRRQRPIGWDEPFSTSGMAVCEIPFGMPLDEADRIAETVEPKDVVAYSAAVTRALLAWLESATDAEIGEPSASATGHWDLSSRYTDPAYREEIAREDMTGWPVWKLFSRPALLHGATHLTEVDVARKAARAAVG